MKSQYESQTIIAGAIAIPVAQSTNSRVRSILSYRDYAKRVLDIFLVLVAAPVVVPVILVLAVLIAQKVDNLFIARVALV